MKTTSGSLIDFEIEKGYDEDLGLDRIYSPAAARINVSFASLTSSPQACAAHCIKDDDYRLSFLEGNYITLTNLREEDIARIITENLSLHISVHSTNPHIRGQLLGRTAQRHTGCSPALGCRGNRLSQPNRPLPRHQ